MASRAMTIFIVIFVIVILISIILSIVALVITLVKKKSNATYFVGTLTRDYILQPDDIIEFDSFIPAQPSQIPHGAGLLEQGEYSIEINIGVGTTDNNNDPIEIIAGPTFAGIPAVTASFPISPNTTIRGTMPVTNPNQPFIVYVKVGSGVIIRQGSSMTAHVMKK